MSFQGLLVTEIFYSLQGETSFSGVPFVFVRLTGCNLRCTYCDSAYAFKGGTKMSFEAVLAEIKKYNTEHVLLTGGEPLLQRGTIPFMDLLNEQGYQVSVETHGEVSIESASKKARIVMDIKTPGSKMNRGLYLNNLKFLKKTDEIKFVITSEDDYHWAKEIVKSRFLPTKEILFSPSLKAIGSPGSVEGIDPRKLADLILKDQLQVRFQLQLHKQLWGLDTKGV
jgi:7-carboxy-7-deazaguanine synthase